MAGITAARKLARAQYSVAVLEARNRIGGRIMTLDEFCDGPVEGGAEFVHGRKAATLTEVHAAGLNLRGTYQMRRTAFNLDGATRWLPLACLHPGTWACAGMRGKIARSEPPDLSAREFIDKHGYKGRARQLTEMTFLQHLPGSADDVGVLGLVDDGVLDLQTRYNQRIIEGYGSLPRSMADGLDIRLNSNVEAIIWDADKVRIRLDEGHELEARAVISTLPVGVLKSNAVRFEPALPETKQWAISQIEVGPIIKILMQFQEGFWPRWMEMAACATGPVNLYWSVFRNVKERPPVLTGYCIGPRAAELSGESDERAIEIVMADLQRLFPKAAPHRALVNYRLVNWGKDPFAGGGYSYLRPGARGARESLRATDTGALFWAGAGTESQPVSELVETAYLSGLRAAAEASAYLETP
ncbi:MAG: NAD(P)/FAD-dependent oxidoreductase, partial [Alphaproteobacteria bacterium]